MNCKGGPHLVWFQKIFQSRHWAVNCHGGKPQTYKTHRDHHCIHIGNACCYVLPHLGRCHFGHGRPHQKAWWSCQSWWEVHSYVQCVISLQGPGYFCKTRWWHPFWCNGAPGGVFTHWLGTVSVPVLWLGTVWVPVLWLGTVWVPVLWLGTVGVFAIVVIMGLEHPIPWVTRKEPWVWVLLHLLWLCSCMVSSGSTGLEGWDEVTSTQCNDSSLARTSSSVNDVSSSIASHNSLIHAANWCGWPAWGSWAFSAQNYKALA